MPPKQYENPPGLVIEATKEYRAIIKTDKGDMTIQLMPEVAPRTVNNFVFLAKDGFYEDNQFHRVDQRVHDPGRLPTGRRHGRTRLPFPRRRGDALLHAGHAAMANAGPNTNGSQWFIVHGADVGLPPNYTIFGMLTEGDDVLEALATSPVRQSRGVKTASPPSGLRSRTSRSPRPTADNRCSVL